MTIIPCSLKRWWIALASILGLALTTAGASNAEKTRRVGPTVTDRATSACPRALSDQKQVDEKGRVLNADRLASAAAAQICTNSYGDRCSCRSQRLAGTSSKTGYHLHKGRTHSTATPVRTGYRPRAHFLHVHGGLSLCWGGRLAATLAKQRSNGADDDKASDDPNDDDDAYQDLNVFDDSEVPSLPCLPEPVPYLAAAEFAPQIWVAPHFTPFSTLQQLRC